MFYSAAESCSAVFGINRLRQLGYKLAGVSGVVSSNPLNTRETLEHGDFDVPVVGTKDILQPGFGAGLYSQYQGGLKKIQTV